MKEPLGSIDCEIRGDFGEVLWRGSLKINEYMIWTFKNKLKQYVEGILPKRLFKVSKIILNQSWSANNAPWMRIMHQDRFYIHIYYMSVGN